MVYELKDRAKGAIQPEMLWTALYNLKEKLVILPQQNPGHIKQMS